MHIPDGFIAPQFYLPASIAAAALLAYALRRVRRGLREDAVPLLAALSALSFALMMIALPLPGGTTAHASGIALLALSCGLWTSYVALSTVLLMQALVFGAGGVTVLGINALAMGFAAPAAALLAHRLLHARGERLALIAAGWLAVVTAAVLQALALGVQPAIASRADGTPLFFPFGLSITLPAVVLPHAFIGIAEGLLTVTAFRYVRRLRGEAGA